MQLTINRKKLLEALDRAAGIAAAKTAMPITTNALLECDGKALTVSATDTLVSSRTVLEVDADKFAFCVNAKAIAERVRLLDTADVTLAIGDKQVTIKASGSRRKYELSTIDGADFPKLFESTGSQLATIAAVHLESLLGGVLHATSNDTDRLALHSVLLEIDNGKIRGVAADGNRIATSERECEYNGTSSILLPQGAAIQLRKLAGSFDGQITLRTDGPMLLATTENTTLGLRQADCQFVPYEQVIAHLEKSVTVSRQSLLGSIQAVEVSSDSSRGIALTIDKESITVESVGFGPNSGTAVDTIDAKATGRVKRLGVCAQYLTSALKALDSEFVVIRFDGILDLIQIKTEPEPDGIGNLQLIAPMKVG